MAEKHNDIIGGQIMGILNFLNKKRDSKKDRKSILEENAGIPFDAKIKDDRQSYDERLAYSYNGVKCDITNNIDGMREGAVLYVRKNGVLANVCKEEILQIKNTKLIEMINDFFDKQSFSCLRAKYVSEERGFVFINLGFFRDNHPNHNEDDEDDDVEDE